MRKVPVSSARKKSICKAARTLRSGHSQRPLRKSSIMPIMTFRATWLKPITRYMSQGNPVALAGADLSMDGIRTTLIHFLIVVVVSVMLVISVFMALMYFVLKKQVVLPITSLQKSMKL